MKGSIRQRSKGSWQLRYDILDPESGMRKYVSETVRVTKKEAERVLRKRLVATNTTVRTQEGYRGNIKRYIVPIIGSVPVQNVAPGR